MTVTFTQSRVNQELAKEGVLPFPRFWGSGWPVGAPTAGLMLHFIPSFIVIIAIPFGEEILHLLDVSRESANSSLGDAYNFILDVEGYPSSVINFFVVIGLCLLRWKTPHVTRPFRVWWPVAVFFMIGQAFLLVAPFLRPPGGKGDTSLPYWLYPIVGIVVLVGGVIYWFGWRKVLPAVGRFTWEEHKSELEDGTIVTRFKKVKRS